jgi:hypothetical protein
VDKSGYHTIASVGKFTDESGEWYFNPKPTPLRSGLQTLLRARPVDNLTSFEAHGERNLSRYNVKQQVEAVVPRIHAIGVGAANKHKQ